jgi:hypothetical protein
MLARSSYLTEQASKNPAAFITLGGKLLPLQVATDPNNPPVVEIARYADKGTQPPGIHAVPAPKTQ